MNNFNNVYARVITEDDVHCIATLSYLNNTFTNEHRSGIVNPNYATYNGNRFMVEEIKSIKTNETYDKAYQYIDCDQTTEYVVGNVVENEYEEGLNVIPNGIMFFKTNDAALCYELQFFDETDEPLIPHVSRIISNWTGNYKKYFDNGRLQCDAQITNGLGNGQCRYWHPSGNISQLFYVFNDLIHGNYQEWYDENNLKYKQVNYINGNKNGLETRWFTTGQISSKLNYSNDMLHGKCEKYLINNQKIIECFYNNGELNGVFKRWSADGELLLECLYSNGNIANVVFGDINEGMDDNELDSDYDALEDYEFDYESEH